jgi:hypothetical protein
MTLSKENSEDIKNLLPLYMKGLLSDSASEKVEKAIAAFPDLKEEAEAWSAIKKAYQDIESDLPLPSSRVYPRIAERISKEVSSNIFERLFLSRNFSFAIIAVQMAIIVFLGVSLFNLKNEYRTLSIPSVNTESLIAINVVFKENITESEIREVLLKINGKIIDGPYSSGLYVIGIASEEEIENALSNLRESGIVEMAEKIY